MDGGKNSCAYKQRHKYKTCSGPGQIGFLAVEPANRKKRERPVCLADEGRHASSKGNRDVVVVVVATQRFIHTTNRATFGREGNFFFDWLYAGGVYWCVCVCIYVPLGYVWLPTCVALFGGDMLCTVDENNRFDKTV